MVVRKEMEGGRDHEQQQQQKQQQQLDENRKTSNTERGYLTCGVKNRVGKPCQRIGVCPFHLTRTSLHIPNNQRESNEKEENVEGFERLRKSASDFEQVHKRKWFDSQVIPSEMSKRSKGEVNSVTSFSSSFIVKSIRPEIKKEEARDELRRTYPAVGTKRAPDVWGLDPNSQYLLRQAAQSQLQKLMAEERRRMEEKEDNSVSVSPTKVFGTVKPSLTRVIEAPSPIKPFPTERRLSAPVSHRCPVHHTPVPAPMYRHSIGESPPVLPQPTFPSLRYHHNTPPNFVSPNLYLNNVSTRMVQENVAPNFGTMKTEDDYTSGVGSIEDSPLNFLNDQQLEPNYLEPELHRASIMTPSSNFLHPPLPRDHIVPPIEMQEKISIVPFGEGGILDHPHYGIPPNIDQFPMDSNWLDEIHNLDFEPDDQSSGT